ncbi:MAG TPA: lytic transglycosylase domain-containing protein, partial [Myxococcota bacterium]|nr:lytic transglycosylase domain-containing protein [Myxococcota bacterium]
ADGTPRRNIAKSPFSAGPFGREQVDKVAPIPDEGGGESPRAPEGLGNEPERLEERERLYAPFIDEAATLYRLPPELIGAVIRVESNYRYRAVSEKGAMGLMQLMPSVVREMGVGNPWDPRANILGGARLLRVLADRFEGDLVKVLAAYHAGSGAVKGAEGIPYEATESYVRSVLDRYYEYKSRAPRE